LLAVLAVAFGVAASIGLGVRQLQSGVGMLGNWDLSANWIAVLVLCFVFGCYMLSAASGLGKGIKILSNINMGLAAVLMLMILFLGPTGEIFKTIGVTLVDYLSSLAPLSVGSSPIYENAEWLGDWTLPYFVWWVSWAPFVGVFVARISRGRTIRQFVFGILLAPTAFTILSFSIYGGTALSINASSQGAIADVTATDSTLALFAVLEHLPLGLMTSIMVMLLMFIFLITSADSATYVLSTLTSGGGENPPRRRTLVWGICLAVLAGALMLTGGVRAVLKVGISVAIPYTLVMVLQCGAILKLLLRPHASSDDSDSEPPPK